MNGSLWLKIEALKKFGRWSVGGVHAYKLKPATAQNEIAIQVTIQIPDAFFEVPQFKANIKVPEDVVSPLIVETEVASNIAEVLTRQLGMTVRVQVDDFEEVSK